MYRYSVDNAVTYTPNDFVLFRESPFALWMERLTLENPDHGIPPDVGSSAPQEHILPQDEIVDTLREEGRDVVLIDWDLDESRRRAATLEAMRNGADFIVNGVLALGTLSADANLLMRTSGYSDFGDYLYIPCDTQAGDADHAAFRLSFLADLLQSLQGQLPPQMLLIRGDSDVLPLQTDDHIYYFRAVKQRFMETVENFRKHRMPDPAESSHFGRWSECASEVLKQRALSAEYQRFEAEYEDYEEDEQALEEAMQPVAASAAQGGAVAAAPTSGAAMEARSEVRGDPRGEARAEFSGQSAPTLAEQARMLSPEALKAEPPGRTPNLAHFPTPVREEPEAPENEVDEDTQAASGTEGAGEQDLVEEVSAADFFDDTLQNLAFIGSSEVAQAMSYDAPLPAVDNPMAAPEPELPPVNTPPLQQEEPALAPSPTLREGVPEPHIEGYEVEVIDVEAIKRESPEPHLLTPGKNPPDPRGSSPAPGDESAPTTPGPFVDLDSAPPPTLMPVELSSARREEGEAIEAAKLPRGLLRGEDEPAGPADDSFSSNLITSYDFPND